MFSPKRPHYTDFRYFRCGNEMAVYLVFNICPGGQSFAAVYWTRCDISPSVILDVRFLTSGSRFHCVKQLQTEISALPTTYHEIRSAPSAPPADLDSRLIQLCHRNNQVFGGVNLTIHHQFAVRRIDISTDIFLNALVSVQNELMICSLTWERAELDPLNPVRPEIMNLAHIASVDDLSQDASSILFNAKNHMDTVFHDCVDERGMAPYLMENLSGRYVNDAIHSMPSRFISVPKDFDETWFLPGLAYRASRNWAVADNQTGWRYTPDALVLDDEDQFHLVENCQW